MFEVKKVYEGSNNIVYVDKKTECDEITLKWDGCVDYRVEWATNAGESDYIHICDIDEMIAKLQEIKRLGAEHFNNEYWIK